MEKRKPVVTGPGKAAKTRGRQNWAHKHVHKDPQVSWLVCHQKINMPTTTEPDMHIVGDTPRFSPLFQSNAKGLPSEMKLFGTQWWTKPQISFEELMQVCTGCAKTNKQTRKKPKQNSNQPQQRNKLTPKKPTKKPTPKPNHQKTPTKQNQSTNSNPRKCREWWDFKPAFWPLIGLLWTRIMLQSFPQFLPQSFRFQSTTSAFTSQAVLDQSISTNQVY